MDFLYTPYNSAATRQVLRFVVSGTLGITINLSSFYIFLHLAHAPYLAASVLALCVSTSAGFVLQKYWTFAHAKIGVENKTKKIKSKVHTETLRQLILYTGVAIINLGIDAVVVFVMVDALSLNKFLAQATAAVIVAFWSFLLYKNFLFAERVV